MGTVVDPKVAEYVTPPVALVTAKESSVGAPGEVEIVDGIV
jgi:hypothetical protein